MEKGLTLKQLAALSGFAHQTVQRYETGAIEIGLRRLARIADALGVPADILVNRREPSSGGDTRASA